MLMNGLEVWHDALDRASVEWTNASDDAGATRGKVAVANANGRSLGPRVDAAFSTFCDMWIGEPSRLATIASDHSAALTLAKSTYIAGDEEVEAAMAGLLPWEERSLSPVESAPPAQHGVRAV